MYIKDYMMERGLKLCDVAPILFPGNKVPEQALRRIFRGESELSVSQMAKLMHMGEGGRVSMEFKLLPSKRGRDVIEIAHGDFKGCVDFENGLSIFYYKDEVVTSLVMHSKTLTFPQFVEMMKAEVERARARRSNL